MTNPTGDALKASAAQVKPITLDILRDYFVAMDAGDVPDPALALYTYLLMDGFVSQRAAAADIRAALSPVEQAPQPVAVEPVAWRWSDTGSSQGYDMRFSEYPVNPSPYVSDVTPLYEHPAPTEAPPVESQAAGWQPIETAPNGAKGVCWMLLAYGPEGDQSVSMGMRFQDKFYAAGTFYIGGPFEGKQYAFKEHEVTPTHWMPTPAAPALAAEGSAE